MAYDDRCKFFEIRIVKVMDGDSIRADLSQGFSDWKMSPKRKCLLFSTGKRHKKPKVDIFRPENVPTRNSQLFRPEIVAINAKVSIHQPENVSQNAKVDFCST